MDCQGFLSIFPAIKATEGLIWGGGSTMARKAKTAPKKPTSIDFHLIKSNSFRVVYCNGAFGGLTPRGEISMAFYNERFPLPTKVTNRLKDGVPAEEVSRESRSGILREVEVAVHMNLATAISIHEWLGNKISELRTIEAQRISEAVKGKKDDTVH
jgi:hypothetical protein